MKNRGIIVISSLVVIGGGIAYLLWKRKKNKEEEISANTAPTSADTPSAATPSSSSTPSATPASSGTPSSTPASAGTPPKSGTTPKDFIYSPSTVAPNQAKGFPVGSVIVPKIPLLYLDLLLVDGKTSIGQVKKATTIALVNSPNWLYVKAMVQQPNGFPVEKRGYIKTNTAQISVK